MSVRERHTSAMHHKNQFGVFGFEGNDDGIRMLLVTKSRMGLPRFMRHADGRSNSAIFISKERG